MADGLQVALNGGIGYRLIQRLNLYGRVDTVTGAGDWIASGAGVVGNPATGNTQIFPLYLDSADYAVTGMTPVLRLVSGCVVNATGPGVTLKTGLYGPASAVVGAAGVINPTVAVIAASQVTFASPAAGSLSAPTSSGDFTFPAAGWYFLGVNSSGAWAAASALYLPTRLEVRLT